jgi:acyl-CoA thioesterase-1
MEFAKYVFLGGLAVTACSSSPKNGAGVDSGASADGSAANDASSDGSTAADAGPDATGDGSTATADASDDGGACAVGSKLQHSNPIVSRGKLTFSSPTGGDAVVDGTYHNGGWSAGMPTTAAPSWVAIELGAGPTRVLVSWDDGGTYNYYEPTMPTSCAADGTGCVYGLAAGYHIDVSADSTNGVDGTWTTKVTIADNVYRTRAHSFDFTGMAWVKMVITAAPPNISSNGVQIGEIDVHDVSTAGSCLPEDTWFFMGDSVTAFAYDRADAHQPSFAAGIHSASPDYFPAMINGGIGGELSKDGLARLKKALADNPDYRFFALSYGTNDSANDQTPAATYKTNMQSMIQMVQAAGRIPVIPHIPYSGDGMHAGIPSYNAAIDALVQGDGLMPGPDFYSYFMNDTSLFTCGCSGGRMTDNLHPNDQGLAGMNALWTTAMRSLYP